MMHARVPAFYNIKNFLWCHERGHILTYVYIVSYAKFKFHIQEKLVFFVILQYKLFHQNQFDSSGIGRIKYLSLYTIGIFIRII